ncbi:hypothetical protein KO527_05190 [Pseudoalteromonas sp. C2R02]|uniref:hypothetical protein n=1 Tax=Pseudoalteromonas sp. C2R02 TaxID=2841565 RepID=UPI001C081C9D|nr:hypothetical protein [Pseudoalteromonas sp. C2R02]MBU2968742.1 hypothetical protein [Pseudoalteromonas sp. C2R02]
MAQRIDWQQQLVLFAQAISEQPCTLQDFCTQNDLPFGTAKRWLSVKKAKAFLLDNQPSNQSKSEKNKATRTKPKKSETKNKNAGSTKKATKPPPPPAGNQRGLKTGRHTSLQNMSAETIKDAVLQQIDNDTSGCLNLMLTKLYAQQIHVDNHAQSVMAELEVAYEDELENGSTDIEAIKEGNTFAKKALIIQSNVASATADVIDAVSRIEERKFKIEKLKRELGHLTRHEELELIKEALSTRQSDELSALETVQLIEAHGIEPPMSLVEEMKREISFIEPVEEELEGVTDEEIAAEVVQFEDSMSKKMQGFMESRKDLFNSMQDDLNDDIEADELNESDFE